MYGNEKSPSRDFCDSLQLTNWILDSGTRWQITIVIHFFPGENITTPTILKGKNFTPRGITSNYP